MLVLKAEKKLKRLILSGHLVWMSLEISKLVTWILQKNMKFIRKIIHQIQLKLTRLQICQILKIVNEEFEKIHTVSVSGLESVEICRQAFEKDLMAAIDKDAEAKKSSGKSGNKKHFYYC